jgi:hypothetical protein
LAILVLVVGCSKSEFETISAASSDPDHIGEEPVGLPTDLPDTLEPLHSVPSTNTGDFSLSEQTYKLAHGPAQVWNGCDSNAPVMGGYNSDSKCGKGYFHPLFAAHLNKNLFTCVERSALQAGISIPSRIFIRHLGTYANRNGRQSSSLSMHAYARAIDIAQLNLYDRFGNVTAISNEMKNYSGATAIFYDAFRACWKESLPSSCRPGQKEYNGSIGHPKSALGGNNLHTRHIHLSYPFCAE